MRQHFVRACMAQQHVRTCFAAGYTTTSTLLCQSPSGAQMPAFPSSSNADLGHHETSAPDCAPQPLASHESLHRAVDSADADAHAMQGFPV